MADSRSNLFDNHGLHGILLRVCSHDNVLQPLISFFVAMADIDLYDPLTDLCLWYCLGHLS